MTQQDKLYEMLNAKKKRTLVYQLTKRGCGSELNHLILGILYCLVNDIRFVLYSRGWNSKYNKGWNDYFMPFCQEYTSELNHRRSVSHPGDINRRMRFIQNRILRNNKMDIIDVWGPMRDPSFTDNHFNIPELGIDGDIFHAKKIILSIIYNYTDEIKEKILTQEKLLNSIQPFFCLHLRYGDKYDNKWEILDPVPTSEYIQIAKNHCSDIENLFLMSDDYNEIQLIKPELSKLWNVTTLCSPNKYGFFENDFRSITNREEIKQHMIEFFIDLHFAKESQFFIGDYASNMTRLVALMKGREKCIAPRGQWHSR